MCIPILKSNLTSFVRRFPELMWRCKNEMKKEIKIPTNLSIYEPLWLRLSVLMNTGLYHCRFWLHFHYCQLVYDCTVKSLPFFTTFSLLSTCVWLYCEITAVFDHFFTLIYLSMIALWNKCPFDHLVCWCMIALWNQCRFWPLFHYCLLVYDALWNNCRF